MALGKTIGVHRLKADDWRSLARQPGNTRVHKKLASAIVSRNLLALSVLVRGGNGLTDSSRDAVAVLRRAQVSDSEEFQSLLTHPHVSQLISQLTFALDDVDDAAVNTNISMIAAALAARVGDAFQVDIPVIDRTATTILIPSLGAVVLPADHASRVVLRRRQTVLEVAFDESEDWQTLPEDLTSSSSIWIGMRRLVADDIAIDVDDITMPVAGEGFASTGRLSDEKVLEWQHRFDGAIEVLRKHHPHWLSDVAANYRSFLPIEAPDGTSNSVTTNAAFGACALTYPHDDVSFAVTLVHELQHNKLNVTLLMESLSDSSCSDLFYAPWRPDPRPLSGMLHGIYAFYGVTHFWQHHRTVETDERRSYAEFEFARWRGPLLAAIEQVLDCGALSESGRNLLSSLRETVEEWQRQEVTPEATYMANLLIDDHAKSWKLANLESRLEVVEQAASRWPVLANSLGASCPGEQFSTSRSQRPQLVRERMGGAAFGPGESAVRTGPTNQTIHQADLALIDGRVSEAKALYEKELHSSPLSIAAWSGYLLALERHRRASGHAIVNAKAEPQTLATLWGASPAEFRSSVTLDEIVDWSERALV